jgi:dTDP-4-dehydrorhamnose reductase
MTTANRGPVLVVGGTGLLGSALLRALSRAEGPGPGRLVATRHASPATDAPGVAWERLDLADPAATSLLVARLAPSVVVHAALPSGGPADAAAIVDGAARLALAAHQAGAAFVHVSSDMVFDGAHGPFGESAPLSPLTAYGRAKAEAERAVRAAHAGTIVVRAPLLYRIHPPDRSLAAWLLGLERGDAYPLFEDEVRCPAHVDDVAEALARLARRLVGGETIAPPAGALHAVGPVPVSRHALGVALLKALGRDPARARSGRLADSGLIRPRELVLTTLATPRWLTDAIRAPSHALGVPVTPWSRVSRPPPEGR